METFPDCRGCFYTWRSYRKEDWKASLNERMGFMNMDLSLGNKELYEGCEIGEVGGRLTLLTSPEEAANIIGRNCTRMIIGGDREEVVITGAGDRKEVVLTGPMAVWAYLVIFHIVVHKFGQVWYDDGRGNRILVAQH